MKNAIKGFVFFLVCLGILPLSSCNNTLETLNVKFIAVSENYNQETSVRFSTTGFSWPQSYVTPLTQTNRMNGAAYGDGNFIVVGAGNYAYQSTDGMNWISTDLGDTYTYNGIAFEAYNGQSPATPYFVAVGAYGAVMYSSTHGKFWDIGASGTSLHLNGVACGINLGNFVFVAVGNASSIIPKDTPNPGTIIYSLDTGNTWTEHTAGGTTHNLYCVAFGVGGVAKFIAAGENGTMVYSTSDLSHWDTITTSNTEDIRGLACGTADGSLVWVAVGANGTLLYSTDNGATWSNSSYVSAISWQSVAYRQSRFYAVGNDLPDSQIIYSDDGVTWNLAASFPFNDDRFRDIACK